MKISKAGLIVEKQKPMPLIYEEVKLDIGYRMDLLVEKSVVIEVKSCEALNDVHLAQSFNLFKIKRL
ncbi:MAG: GxxExxY protein [Cloacibacterium normanense]